MASIAMNIILPDVTDLEIVYSTRSGCGGTSATSLLPPAPSGCSPTTSGDASIHLISSLRRQNEDLKAKLAAAGSRKDPNEAVRTLRNENEKLKREKECLKAKLKDFKVSSDLLLAECRAQKEEAQGLDEVVRRLKAHQANQEKARALQIQQFERESVRLKQDLDLAKKEKKELEKMVQRLEADLCYQVRLLDDHNQDKKVQQLTQRLNFSRKMCQDKKALVEAKEAQIASHQQENKRLQIQLLEATEEKLKQMEAYEQLANQHQDCISAEVYSTRCGTLKQICHDLQQRITDYQHRLEATEANSALDWADSKTNNDPVML